MRCVTCPNEARTGLYCDTCRLKQVQSFGKLFSESSSSPSFPSSPRSSSSFPSSSSSSSSFPSSSSSSSSFPSSSSSSSIVLSRDENGQQYETVHQFIARTNIIALYRVVRTIVGTRKKGPGIPGTAMLLPELNIKTGMEKLENLIRISKEGLPGSFIIEPAINWGPLIPAYQVSGEYATQYISTGARPEGALVNCLKSWNSGSERGRRLRGIESWDPVIEINLTVLSGIEGIKIYDMTAEYITWPSGSSAIAGNAHRDREVLINGRIPRGALRAVCALPGEIAFLGLAEKAIAPEELFETLWSARGSSTQWVADILRKLFEKRMLDPKRALFAIMLKLSEMHRKETPSMTFIKALIELLGKEKVLRQLGEQGMHATIFTLAEED